MIVGLLTLILVFWHRSENIMASFIQKAKTLKPQGMGTVTVQPPEAIQQPATDQGVMPSPVPLAEVNRPKELPKVSRPQMSERNKGPMKLAPLRIPEATPSIDLSIPQERPQEQQQEEGQVIRPKARPEGVEPIVEEQTTEISSLRPESTEAPTQPVTESTFTKQSANPAQNLLDRIAFGEGADPTKLKIQEELGIGSTPYDMVYAYGKTLAPNKPVSEMTMREVFDFQTALIKATKGKVKGTSLGTSAVGKYQVLRKSLFGNGTPEDPMENSWADKLGLDENTIFSPEVQEKVGMLALREAGYNSFRSGKKSEEAFHNRISDIWASVAKADGTDKYGQGIHTLKADLQSMYNSILGKE